MTRLGQCTTFTLLLLLVASPALAQTTTAPEDFVLFADETLKARGLIVNSGDVGANVSLKGTKKILAPNSRIVAGTVDLHPGTTCDALLANSGQSTAGCGPRMPVSIPIIADVAAACGAPTSFPPCNPSASVFVPHDGTTTLPPGTYGDVTVSGGGAGPGKLILTGGTYTFCNVRVNRNGQLLARAPVTVNITGDTKFDNGSNIGPESGLMSPCDVRFFSNGAKFRVSRKGHLQGVVCAPNAKLEFTQGATLRGAFFAREVKSDRVTLTQEDCLTTTTTTTTTTTIPGPVCNNGVVDPGEPCDPSSPGGAFSCEPNLGCTETCTCVTATTTSTIGATTSTVTTTSSTTTSAPGLCNNGVVDPGEPCDPSSPGGAFSCEPNLGCTETCTCVTATTTSTIGATTSTVTTTSSTTTSGPGLCNNGVVDPGEPCDPTSPGGAFTCEPNLGCTEVCTCVTATTSTTTTIPGTCNNGVLDPGEPCDPTSPGGAFTCEPNLGCTEVCTCITASTSTVPTTSSTSTSVPTTTTTEAPATTTTSTIGPASTTTTSTIGPASTTTTSTIGPASTTTTSTTTASTTTTGGGTATAFDFQSTAGTGTCGQTFRDLAGTIPLKNLLCGNLSLGGGISQVPNNTTPPGSTNRFAISGCAGGVCNVGPIATATSDFDCTTTGCFFGTPLPIANAGLSVCVTNTFSQPVAGTINTTTGDITMTTFQLNSATVLTGNEAQPCPRCAVSVGGAACVGSPASPCTGVCDGSPNQGAACTTKNPAGLTVQCPSPAATGAVSRCFKGPHNNAECSSSADCACHTNSGTPPHTDPQPCTNGLCALFIGDIPITLNPLSTGTVSKSNADGLFCTGQTATQKGAFRTAVCQAGANSGKPCDTNAECPDSNCRSGTLNNICSAGTNNGKGCAINANCGSGLPCTGTGQGTCAAGEVCNQTTDVCDGAANSCVKAGTLVQLIQLEGAPGGALATGVAVPVKLASVFCVPTTVSALVNGNANLPGPGATALVGTVTLVP